MATNARVEELKRKFEENPRRYFAPLANEYRKQGDFAQAIAMCRTHLPNQPGHISGHIVLAQALYEAKELPESRQIFEQALELDPENLIALRSLGDIARAQDDVLAARAWYERVLDADPRNDEIANVLRDLAAEVAVAQERAGTTSSFEPPAPAPEPEPAREPVAAQPTTEAVAAQIPSGFDPDKTPVASPVIRDEATIASSAPTTNDEELPDIFGVGIEDQGAELLEAYQPTHVAPLSFFEQPTATPEPPAEPVDANAFELSEAAAATAEPQAAEEPEAPVAAVGEAARESAPETFIETLNAFAAAQELSDPEATPQPLSDDWFNAPTPPRGVIVRHDEFEVAGPSPDEPFPETKVSVPTPVAGSVAQSTSVSLDAFDLIDGGKERDEDATPVSSSAISDQEEHPAAWFDVLTPSVESASVEFDEEIEVAEPTADVTESREDEYMTRFPEALEQPPHVELEAEPEPAAIDRGYVGGEDVFGSIALSEGTHSGEAAPSLVNASSDAESAFGRVVPESDEASSETPMMFVTETMAELYLQQGFTEEALAIYRKLLEQSPADEGLQARISALTSGAPSTVEAAAGVHAIDRHGQSVRTFFGRVAARRPRRRRDPESALDLESLGAQVANRHVTPEPAGQSPAAGPTLTQLFAGAEEHPSDDAAAARLASAFTPEASGRPTRAADSELSLDHLFRDVPQEASSAVTLDAFFAAPGGEASASDSATAESDERTGDIEQFTAWLEGLKKK